MIEFLFWDGCPSAIRARELLAAQMAELEISADRLREIELFTHEDAERERFIGSPTIRVDGVDISDPGDTQYGLECRLYYHRNGRPSPLPDADDLKEALSEYARKGK